MGRFLLLALLLSRVSAVPEAQAAGETLKRAASHLVCAPLDFVLSPVVAAQTLWRDWDTQGDTPAVKAAYLVPGFFWLTAVQMGGSALREVTGFLELLPGIGLWTASAFGSELELDPLFVPAERGSALVDRDTPVLHLKFGIDYTSPPS